VDAIAPGLIATGGHYAAATHAPDDEGLPLKAAVAETLDRDEKGIQVQMKYCFIVHRPKIRHYFDYLTVK
jgi:hypothetical protein